MSIGKQFGKLLLVSCLFVAATCDPGFDEPGHLAGVAVRGDRVVAVLSACLPDQPELTYAPKKGARASKGDVYRFVAAADVRFGVP